MVFCMCALGVNGEIRHGHLIGHFEREIEWEASSLTSTGILKLQPGRYTMAVINFGVKELH